MKKILCSFFTAFTLFLCGCIKDKYELANPKEVLGEWLTEEELALAEQYTVPNSESWQMTLPNGMTIYDFMNTYDPDYLNSFKTDDLIDDQGPQGKKNWIIGRLLLAADDLADKTKYQYLAGTGYNEPAQNGIVYGWGNKNHEVRRAGSESEGSICQEKVHGLDCSGFMYQLYKKAGLPMNKINAAENCNAEHLAMVSTINKLLTNHSKLSKLYAKNLGQIPVNQLQAGDIVYWHEGNANKKGRHIGIIGTETNGQKTYFASNGGPGTTQAKCTKNLLLGPTKGSANILPTFHNSSYGNTFYDIVRIMTDISGSWEFNLRCKNATTDVISFNINFNPGSDAEFTETAINVMDYDSSYFNIRFYFNYDAVNNRLSCTYNTYSTSWVLSRTDSFTVKLDFDDTGYVLASKVLEESGTCETEVRLINLER